MRRGTQEKESQLSWLLRMTSGPKKPATAGLKSQPKGQARLQYSSGVVIKEVIHPDTLERIKWVVPDFDKIHFNSVESLEEAAYHYLKKLREMETPELLAQLNYQHGRAWNKEFPYSGEGSREAFLKRVLKYHSFPSKQPALLGQDWKYVVTACIAFRARRLPIQMWKAPELEQVDRNLRAPREKGFLTISDAELIDELWTFAKSRNFDMVDFEFIGRYVPKMKEGLSHFRFNNREDRVRAERLSLTDWELLRALVILACSAEMGDRELEFVALSLRESQLEGIERFSFAQDRIKANRLFDKVAVADEKILHDQIEKFRSLVGHLHPVQQDILTRETSIFVSHIKQSVVETKREVCAEEQLDFRSIPEPPWDGKASQQVLFELEGQWFW